MYHCHISLHEDEGMMGQFVVAPSTTGIEKPKNKCADFSLFPNPAGNTLNFRFENSSADVYYLRIRNALGKVNSMVPRPEWQNGIDISHLSPGVYFAEITDAETKEKTIRKFVKN